MANLLDLLKNHQDVVSQNSVPQWLLGAFKRRNITFFDNTRIHLTNVIWLQTQTLTIDLRLPSFEVQLQQNTLEKLCNEAWYGHTAWKNDQLSWSIDVNYELYNKWPEPAELRRIGDCMIEFSPSNTYVEDWNFISNGISPLIGLELFQEENLNTGEIIPLKGAFLICGDYAGLIIDREKDLSKKYKSINDAYNLGENICNILDFEASIGHQENNNKYKVIYSLNPNRVNNNLLDLNGFEIEKSTNFLTYTSNTNNKKWYFKIETYIKNFIFSPQTQK